MNEEIAREIAEILLEIKAVTLNTVKPYRYTSGILSPIYTDNRLLMSYPEQRKKVIEAFVQTIKQNHLDFDVVAGVASSGIPHAAWLAEKMNKPMVYVRKRSKEHGKENLIEGKLEKGQTVILVEDLISTGGSSLGAADALRAYGAVTDNMLAIFSYNMEAARKGFAERKINLYNLCDLNALLDEAIEKNYLKPEEKEKVLVWAENPKDWGKKMGFE